MKWFKKTPVDTAPLALPRQTIVEIEATKDAQKEAFEDARRVGKDLNRLLVENGFTLKIYLAAGGKNPTKTNKGKK